VNLPLSLLLLRPPPGRGSAFLVSLKIREALCIKKKEREMSNAATLIADESFMKSCKFLKETFDTLERSGGSYDIHMSYSEKPSKRSGLIGQSTQETELRMKDLAEKSKHTIPSLAKQVCDLSCKSLAEEIFSTQDTKFDYAEWVQQRCKSRSISDFIADETKYGKGNVHSFCKGMAAILDFHEKDIYSYKIKGFND
jgi:arsenate reductase-like glutaredoxin family protein